MAIRKERENLLYCCMKVGWRLFKKIRSYLSYIKFYVNKPSLQEGNNIPNITVSFTTYPAREKWLPVVVGSLLRQKLQPDRIVLYLSNEQFETVDDKILNSIKKQGVNVKLVDGDMRSHKKYLYAFKEYPEDIVITVDDDIIYDKYLISDLYQSYLKHPHAISAKRVHKILFSSDKKVKKYTEWDIATKEQIDEESFDLIATGCGGVLYPPHCISERYTDIDTIKDTCICADDLWLKVMELMKGTPVVLAKSQSYKLKHIGATECDGLALDNVGAVGNDEQLLAICNRLGTDLFKMINYNQGEILNEKEFR